MRSVVVYPAGARSAAVAVLDEVAQQREPYHVDGCLHVSVEDDGDEIPLFVDWEPDEVAALVAVVGHQPTWCVMAHLSWTDEAVESAARLALALLRDGGAACDDYSLHPLTAGEISAGRSERRFGRPD